MSSYLGFWCLSWLSNRKTRHHHHHHYNGLAMAPLNWSSAAPYKVCLIKIINLNVAGESEAL